MAERSFAKEVEQLRVPAGTEFRGEGERKGGREADGGSDHGFTLLEVTP